jgi:CheY-like chemotaxis protein
MDTQEIQYSSESILVVDDEELVRDPIVKMLIRLGFRADSANSAMEALTELKENAYTFKEDKKRPPPYLHHSNDRIFQGIQIH